jgi:hypothetical protein
METHDSLVKLGVQFGDGAAESSLIPNRLSPKGQSDKSRRITTTPERNTTNHDESRRRRESLNNVNQWKLADLHSKAESEPLYSRQVTTTLS